MTGMPEDSACPNASCTGVIVEADFAYECSVCDYQVTDVAILQEETEEETDDFGSEFSRKNTQCEKCLTGDNCENVWVREGVYLWLCDHCAIDFD
jgi:hypothetical protein